MINCFLLGEHSFLEIIKVTLQHSELARLVGSSSDPGEALDFVLNFRPKIVFADAALVAQNRDMLLEIARETNVIYVSDRVSAAYQAFEMMEFNYLLSPTTFDRLEKTINKFIRSSMFQVTAPSNQVQGEGSIIDSFFIKADSKGQKEILVKCSDIIYIKAMQNYVLIYLAKDRQFVSHHTMKEMEEGLPNFHFQRVHKSYIINYQRISSVDGNRVVLDHNEQFQFMIGSSYRKPFFERKNQKMIKKSKGSFAQAGFQPSSAPAALISNLFIDK